MDKIKLEFTLDEIIELRDIFNSTFFHEPSNSRLALNAAIFDYKFSEIERKLIIMNGLDRDNIRKDVIND